MTRAAMVPSSRSDAAKGGSTPDYDRNHVLIGGPAKPVVALWARTRNVLAGRRPAPARVKVDVDVSSPSVLPPASMPARNLRRTSRWIAAEAVSARNPLLGASLLRHPTCGPTSSKFPCRLRMSLRTPFHVTVLLLVSLAVSAPADAASIRIPKYFYGDRLGSCDLELKGRTISLGDTYVSSIIKGVVGYDWDSDHHRNSDSLTVRHERISVPARMLFAASHTALAENDPVQIRQAISFVVRIARANTILNTMTVREVRRMGSKCYEGKGKTSAKCWAHAPQFAAQFAGNYLVSAVLLKPRMKSSERAIVDNYAKKLHKRYIKPWYAESRRSDRGFYQMANGGISELAYAAWRKDKRLASTTFKRIFRDVNRLFYKDGYINNNSFRGVRGFWYHTYGVNSALATIGLARAWNVKVPARVNKKVVEAVRLINVGIADLKKFNSRKFSGYRGNASTNPKHARPHIHQMAIAIDAMAKRYAGITLKKDAVYLRKRRSQGPSDFTVGFHPGCMVRQKA